MKSPTKTDRQKIGLSRRFALLFILLFVFLLLAGTSFVYTAVQERYYQSFTRTNAAQQLLSQQMAATSLEASGGNATAFKRLAAERERFDALMQSYNMDGKGDGPALPDALKSQYSRLADIWTGYRGRLGQIVQGQKSVADITRYVADVDQFVPKLLAYSDQVTSALVKHGASASEVYLAERQTLLALRIQVSLTRVLQGGEGASTAADQFGRDATLFGNVLQGLLTGNTEMQIKPVKDAQTREVLRQVAMIFSSVSDHVATILELAPHLFAIKHAATQVQTDAPQLLGATKVLEAALAAHYSDLGMINLAGYASGGLALLILILSGVLLYRDSQHRLALTTEQNRRNQRAILRLLDEMTNLAEGDLTVHATVTEDITGAIADSVNYAIDALRSLVTTINQTSVQVATAAERTQTTALRLADASGHQAREIASASAAVTDMADSIDRVSKNAMSSADVAKKSVEIAAKGAATVRRSIDGMDTIREQIQDTAKRIKRLGESSQEIGDIVGLINDIADQTNILALNAAIQASAAGEAGRGFAVVADEVQRLAERSANATRQIEALVKAIQSDTGEAVLSMEQSTSNVVAGGQLATDAGDALAEIESVSNQLAKQIMTIASAARQQAAVAANVTNTMNVIQEITMQTSDGTQETAQSIGQLTELAAELRRTVAGFKLPDSEDTDTVVLDDGGVSDIEAA
ncbi:chemotaxis protein [Acidihalobacter aeolianus]|uniref:Chemotaxis protein n=1 Tax=Acidihalobacter aeolianus TaxID=2792603 RepID=A0A1D8KAW1_9GAMM|nr:methyl-accepting chemotaxis protein [Acidihalobacter aeolianus]AOV18094.1 chemotaxis protein [Acidihalobacter aeolianus]